MFEQIISFQTTTEQETLFQNSKYVTLFNFIYIRIHIENGRTILQFSKAVIKNTELWKLL